MATRPVNPNNVFRTPYEREIIEAQKGGSYVADKNIQVRCVPLWARWVLTAGTTTYSLFGDSKGSNPYGEFGSNLSTNASLPKGQSYVAQGIAFRFRNRALASAGGAAVPTTSAMLASARRFLDDCIFEISRENDTKEVYFKGSLMRSTWGELIQAGSDTISSTTAPATSLAEQEIIHSMYRFRVPLVFGQQVTFDFNVTAEKAAESALIPTYGYCGFDVFLIGARTKIVTA